MKFIVFSLVMVTVVNAAKIKRAVSLDVENFTFPPNVRREEEVCLPSPDDKCTASPGINGKCKQSCGRDEKLAIGSTLCCEGLACCHQTTSVCGSSYDGAYCDSGPCDAGLVEIEDDNLCSKGFVCCKTKPCTSWDTLSTPDNYNYQYETDVAATTTLEFEVKASNDVHVALSSQNEDVTDMYEIVIGGWTNSHSVIRREKQGTNLATATTHNIVSPSEYRGFWIMWLGGVIQVGRAGQSTPFMEWTDPSPLNVNWAGYSTGWGSTGDFKFCTSGGGSGDPHMESFDGLKYDFQGYCSYVLVKDCRHPDEPTFQITADFRGRNNPTKPPTRMIAINVSAPTMPTIRLLEDNSFMIGEMLHLGTDATFEMGTVTHDGASVVVQIRDPDISISWNGKPHKVRITLNGMNMPGTVCGLLGNADGDPNNDLIKADGYITSSIEEFGSSWAVPGSCPL